MRFHYPHPKFYTKRVKTFNNWFGKCNFEYNFFEKLASQRALSHKHKISRTLNSRHHGHFSRSHAEQTYVRNWFKSFWVKLLYYSNQHQRSQEFFRGTRSTKGGLVSGFAWWGFAREVFKLFKKTNEKFTIFLQIFMENFAIFFKNILKLHRIFRENLGKKFRKCQKYAFVGGTGGGAPQSWRIYQKPDRKISENLLLF